MSVVPVSSCDMAAAVPARGAALLATWQRMRSRCKALIAMSAAALLMSALPAAGWAQGAAAVGVSPSAAVTASPAPLAEYRLGGGDLIRVLVYQNPDLTMETRLSDNGLISYPLLGALKLGGLTVGESERVIADGLRKGEFVKNPQVSVLLMTARSSQVSVLGQVQRPGRYPLETAQTRLSDVLAQAGGIQPSLGSDQITVVGSRDGKAFRKLVDLPQVFSGEQRPDDIVLQGNDVIFVDRAPVFFIYGQVQKPGMLRLERGMTLLQGLAAGGGLTLRGTDKGIRLHRRAADGRTAVLEPGMDDALRDGDVIYVRESLF
ncbi:MAG TPA: polysaccharide export protein EpsE [Ideonella sp.]|uniref:polysaccharide export protein EpsE n=1 Tax=Ideonella sp. TaxID=1929293 RepID=UPI002CE71F96|nr:polysaccharide export protein EpsE [Ideonella sp.]HSI50572.1 polysaccharide export protein EpsE [Ideonella sp.]